jgi:hypothetical protein
MLQFAPVQLIVGFFFGAFFILVFISVGVQGKVPGCATLAIMFQVLCTLSLFTITFPLGVGGVIGLGAGLWAGVQANRPREP